MEEDKPSIGLCILSFIIPLVGIILFFVQKGEKPVSAKRYLIVAIVAIAISVVLNIIFSIIGASMATDAAMQMQMQGMP